MGPVLWEDDLLVVSHRPLGDLAFPGYLFVETRRHVAALDALEPAEVGAVARAAWLAARALRAELAPQHVFSAIAGRQVAHFHQHVFARHAGTPEHIGWMDPWPGAPRVTATELDALCARLRTHFG
ncbi:histidine triad (HIT) protein [Amycolatopsis albispora]|uniref:Histidine triad (HIT) protein n=1 Tax=Amycolatopsis albispora TaxID=1804986 RepID=A0A344LLC9_9PSEU|nr:histidine triad (HIT) protein [Amycolatopsis albispora]